MSDADRTAAGIRKHAVYEGYAPPSTPRQRFFPAISLAMRCAYGVNMSFLSWREVVAMYRATTLYCFSTD
jgi:hypothetical protein